MKKRIVSALLAALLACLCLSGALAAQNEELRALKARYILVPQGSAVYAKPNLGSASSPAEADIVASVDMGSNSFYRVDKQGGGYLYVLRSEVAGTVYTVKPDYEEAMIGQDEVTVYSFPEEGLGKEVGRLTPGGVCAIDRQVEGFVRVQQGDVTGWVKLDDLILPGCADDQDYYIFVNLAEFKLTVFKGDGQGGRTDEVMHEAIVTIGKKTTPTPTGHFKLKKGYELWHRYGGPSYAPYTIEFTPNRWIHGELCATRDREDKREDRENQFGMAKSGGCIRMPTDLAQWIFYHCAPGTPIEIVKGQ